MKKAPFTARRLRASAISEQAVTLPIFLDESAKSLPRRPTSFTCCRTVSSQTRRKSRSTSTSASSPRQPDLELMMMNGEFRDDLYYRLKAISR